MSAAEEIRVLLLDKPPWKPRAVGEPAPAPKMTRGFPEDDEARANGRQAQRVEYRPLAEVLTTAYQTDAHFSPYCTVDWLPFRLKMALFDHSPDGDFAKACRDREVGDEAAIAKVFDAVEVRVIAIVGDVDDPVAHE